MTAPLNARAAMTPAAVLREWRATDPAWPWKLAIALIVTPVALAVFTLAMVVFK